MRKHIVFLLNGLDNAGGTERVAANLAAALIDDGHRVTLISPYQCEAFLAVDHRVEIAHLDAPRIPLSGIGRAKWFLLTLIKLRHWLKRNKPDIVFSMFFNQSIALALASWQLRLRKFACEHIYYHYHNPIRRLTRRLVYPHLDGLIVLTERDATLYRSFLQHVHVIPNFVEIQSREVLQTPRSNTILAVGRFSEQKGFDLLLEAYRIYSNQNPESWSLTIVGDGPLRQQIELQAYNAGVKDRVHFAGMQRNIEAFFCNAGIFVLSSRFEAFPMVLLEALGAGLPVLSFDCPTGPREILGAGDAGMLVSDQDVNALATGLLKLTTDQSLRQRLAHIGYQRVQSYSREAILNAWRKLISPSE